MNKCSCFLSCLKDLVFKGEREEKRKGEEKEKEEEEEGGREREREREREDDGPWRRVPSSGENDKRVGKLKILKMNFIYFKILPGAKCLN